MNTILKRQLSLVALCLLLAACDGPFLILPGGALSGKVHSEPVNDWSFVNADFVHLETNAGKPYSVELNYVIKNGHLYIDPAEGRTWFEHLKQNLDVRIRFDDTIYPVHAEMVGTPGELAGFDIDRFVYRLDSR